MGQNITETKVKVLVNASTLVVGGGIQIGVSFIREALKEQDIEWLFVVSKGIYENNIEEYKQLDNIIVIEVPPAAIISGRKSRKKIIEIEKKFNPHIAYSIGFPSYISFKSLQVGRYTNPWEINSEPLPWHMLPGLVNKLKIKAGILYRIWWARKANFIETQTDAAKRGIAKRANFPEERIKVIPNSANAEFIKIGSDILFEGQFDKKENFVFCLSAGYEHKNLDLIPAVINELRKINGDCPTFILTLPNDSHIWLNLQQKAEQNNTLSYIKNVGPLKLSECIKYYNLARIVFLPTLLEIFSATYLEAMAMKVPIVTTNLEFAHDNCGKAALFFEPGDAKDAAEKISKLLENKELYLKQIKLGTETLNTYPDNRSKYNTLFNWFKYLALKNETTK